MENSVNYSRIESDEIWQIIEHLAGMGYQITGTNQGKCIVTKRTAIFKEFQETDKPRVLLIQPQAAAHGVTLTAANVIVWYAPVTSSEIYLQANARIDRPGQRNPMTIVHLQGSPVETKLYNMLENNLDLHSKIVDLYKNELEDS